MKLEPLMAQGPVDVNISWQANVMKSDCSPELLVKFAIEILKRYG